jgi:hypothetical protein
MEVPETRASCMYKKEFEVASVFCLIILFAYDLRGVAIK